MICQLVISDMEKNEARKQGREWCLWDAAFLGLSEEMWLFNLQSHFLHYFNYTGIFKEQYYQIKLQFIPLFSLQQSFTAAAKCSNSSPEFL